MNPTKSNQTRCSGRRFLKSAITDIGIYGLLLCVTTFANTWITVTAAELDPGSQLSKQIPTIGQSCKPNDSRTEENAQNGIDVLNYVDSKVKPCDDFYKFACGRFIDNAKLSNETPVVNVIGDMNEDMDQQLEVVIKAAGEPTAIEAFKLVNTLYKSCMNETEIKARGLKDLKRMLEKLLGWPVLKGKSWKKRKFDWIDVIYNRAYKAGLAHSYYLDISVIDDEMNTTRRVISIDQGMHVLLREELLKGFEDDLVQTYHRFMVDVAVILGAPEKLAKSELERALRFEIALANIMTEEQDLINQTELYNPTSLTGLEKNYSSIRWRDIFSSLLPSTISLKGDEIVIVKFPKYVEELEKLLKNTPKRTQANYLIWRMVHSVLGLVGNDEIKEKRRPFEIAVFGQFQDKPRWRKCVSAVQTQLSLSVSAMYARKYVDQEVKQKVGRMFENMKHAYIKMLDKVDWMEDNSKQIALDKAKAMISIVGYHDEFLDDDKLNEYYNNLTFSKHAYFWNTLKSERFNSDNSFRKLRDPVHAKDWTIAAKPELGAAYYNTNDNSITITAEVLRGVYFNKSRPESMNYGALGSYLASLMNYCFNEHGRQYGKDSILYDWWGTSTEEKYLERAKHIIKLYDNYTVDGIEPHVNGTKTLVNNIADIGGVKAAYLAWSDWVLTNPETHTLPDVKYTANQLFWIGMASPHCSKSGPENMKRLIDESPFSPDKFRVIGPVSNIKQFSDDFKCTLGSNMNPATKWSLW